MYLYFKDLVKNSNSIATDFKATYFSQNQNEFGWSVHGSHAFFISKPMIWKERGKQHCRNATKF